MEVFQKKGLAGWPAGGVVWLVPGGETGGQPYHVSGPRHVFLFLISFVLRFIGGFIRQFSLWCAKYRPIAGRVFLIELPVVPLAADGLFASLGIGVTMQW